MSWLAVGFGAALGAWLRWHLALWLSSVHAHVQAGTLAANLAGGYLVGLLLGVFSTYPGIAPEWRLFAITGFLGGLTTFSTFSGEAVALLQRGQYGWAFGHSALHLLGSLAFCMAGHASWRLISSQ